MWTIVRCPVLPVLLPSAPLTRVHNRTVGLALAAITAALVVVVSGTVTSATSATKIAGPHQSKLDRILQQGIRSGVSPESNIRVIIRARSGRGAALRTRLSQHVLKEHPFIGAMTARVRVGDLSVLESDSDVLSVSLDIDVAGGSSTAAGAAALSAAASLNLPAGLTGRGVGVVTIDSGVDPGRDFGPIAFVDFTNALAIHPYDDFGHGTHVAGLIAGKSTVFPGVAPRARLISLKVLDARGVAATSTVIDAIQYAIANRRALGIDVMNLSLGHPILEPAATDPLVQAVEAASRAGIIVVVAAGNFGRNLVSGVPGYAGILSPGNAESVITAGAVDTRNTTQKSDDAVEAYSSRGPTWYDARLKPDVVAPGHNLVSAAAPGSTLFTELPDHQVSANGSSMRYFRLSGTSMAAAVTSGLVALMIEANRAASQWALTPAAAKRILEYSATPLPGFDALTQGHGEIDGGAAIALAAQPPPPASRFWDRSWMAAWEKRAVWGDGASRPVWSSNVVWSTSLEGDTIVWGTSMNGDTIVWGTTLDWGDTIVWGTSATYDNK